MTEHKAIIRRDVEVALQASKRPKILEKQLLTKNDSTLQNTTWKVTSGENKNGVSFFGNLDNKIYLRKHYANLFFPLSQVQFLDRHQHLHDLSNRLTLMQQHLCQLNQLLHRLTGECVKSLREILVQPSMIERLRKNSIRRTLTFK